MAAPTGVMRGSRVIGSSLTGRPSSSTSASCTLAASSAANDQSPSRANRTPAASSTTAIAASTRPREVNTGRTSTGPTGTGRLLLRAVAQREDGERGGQLRDVLQERPVRVRPAPVLGLLLLQLVEQLLPPVVLDPLRILERVLAQRVHRLGEGVVVVVQPGLPLARVLTQCVVLLDPRDRRLHPRVVLAHPGVEETLEPGVGHPALAPQPAGRRPLVALLVVLVERVVHEPTLVVVARLGGERLVVVLALEVLAAADECQCLLDPRVVLAHPGGDHRLDPELRVRHVRPVLPARFAVARPAEPHVLRIDR